MSHSTVYVVTDSSVTLDELDALMRPYREGGPLSMDGQQWDYFTVRGWGTVPDLLRRPDAMRALGVIVRGRGFMRMGEVSPSVVGFYRVQLVAAGVVLRFVEVDVHT